MDIVESKFWEGLKNGFDLLFTQSILLIPQVESLQILLTTEIEYQSL